MALLEICMALVGIGLLIYKWSTATFKTFEERNLYFEKPFPFVGNMGAMAMQKASFQKQIAEFYNRTRHHKIVGLFNLRTPMVQLNDPQLIKKICVKDVDHFPNHQHFISANERLINDMLNVMRDQRWKHMRSILTPVYTASKMRNMFTLMNESFAECIQHLDISGSSPSKNGFEVDMKVLCNKLSNDVIATTAFGLKLKLLIYEQRIAFVKALLSSSTYN